MVVRVRWSLALLALAGCGEEPVATPRQGPAVTELRAQAPVRGRVLGGEPMARTAHWPDALATEVELRAALEPRSRNAIARSTVPVLVPRESATWADARVTAGQHWFSFSARGDGVTITASGSGVARVYPGIHGAQPDDVVRGQPGFVGFNEGVWSARWVEFGVAYSVELECGRMDDPRCADAEYLRSIADGLGYVGGAGEATR